MTPAQSTIFPTSCPLMLGKIVISCENSRITALTSIMVMAMDRLAGQDPALTGQVSVEVAQTRVIRVKVTRVATINNPVMAVNSKTTS